MTLPVNSNGAPAMNPSGCAAEANRLVVKKTGRRRVKRPIPYVRDYGVVPPPLPAYVLNPEKLEHILSKKLQRSDVSCAGRIVLPKRSVETHLPKLTDNQSLFLPVIDLDGGGNWVFKFRYWLNNGGRMYVFEDTAGEYIKKYKLQVGDYILMYKEIYNDGENWDFFIRAVKASEVKGAEKDNANQKDDGIAAAAAAAAESSDILAGENATMSGTSSNNEYWNFDDLNSFISWDEFNDSFPLPTPPSGSYDNWSDWGFPHG